MSVVASRILELVLLGIVQGLTEFLPISSDGHLALVSRWLGITEGNLAITVALHAGTLFAVVIYFRKDIERILRTFPAVARGTAAPEDHRLLLALFLGSIPTAILGLLLKNPTERLSSSLWAIGGFLLISGAWNWVIVARSKNPGTGRGMEALGSGDAFAIGIVQGLAVLPGLSRSASTIGMGVALGLKRELAARYSFLLSLPAVAGALFLEAKDINGLPREDFLAVLLGTFVSFLVGLGALWMLFALLRKGRFDVFAWYCWALGGLVLYLASAA